MSFSCPTLRAKPKTSPRQVRVSYRPMRRRLVSSAERQEPLVETENRERLEVEARNVLPGPIVRQRQPGPRRGEAGMGRTIPLHRRSNRIAAGTDTGLPKGPRIPDLVRRNRHIGHADFIAVIQGRRAAERQQQNSGDLRLLGPNPRRNARPVVVAEHPVGPGAIGQGRLVVFDEPGNGVGLPRRLQQLEIEGEMRAFEIAAVILPSADRAADRFRRSRRGADRRRPPPASPR